MGVSEKELKGLREQAERGERAAKRISESKIPKISFKEELEMLKKEVEEIRKAKSKEEQKKEEPKKRGRPKKVKNKEPINIMKGRADLIGNRVEANINVKKGLKNNEKKALKHAVIEDLDKKIKMSGRSIRRIYLSDSDSD